MAEITEVMKSNYRDYASSVIAERALQDVRDGLNPVQRRILFAMYVLGTTPDKHHRKSARIVGDTMGKYHPHGDSSIYGALVNMAQDWKMRYPLIDGHGNFGSIDGDGAAAMRYTEARLSKLSMNMLTDINKNTVDMVENFDGTELEPKVLPSSMPNIFLNQQTGIAVGMAGNLLSYNLTETVNGLCAYLKNENISLEEIMQYIPGPDFATGCEIINQSDLPFILGKGEGKIKIRARYKVEEEKGKYKLVFYELPPNVRKEALILKIISMVNESKLDGIYNVIDETNKTNIKISIIIKKNFIPEVVAEQLYNKTDLQINFALNNLMLVNKTPKVLGLIDMMKEYCSFQIEVITRKTKFDLNRKLARLHILEGMCKALDNINDVINTIKSSKDVNEGICKLMAAYDLTEVQAKAVIEIKLSRLIAMEKIKLLDEKAKTEKDVFELKEILCSDEKKKEILINDLQEISNKFGDERRTSLSNIDPSSSDDLLLVAREDVVVQYFDNNYIKAVKVDDFKIQSKGGQGVKNTEANVKFAIKTNTGNSLLVVTKKGIMFKLNVCKIPLGKNVQKGLSTFNLLPLEQSDSISLVIDLSNVNKEYILFSTKQGLVKKSSTDLYRNFRSNGTKAILLREDDEIVNISFVDDNENYTMFSNAGKCITFPISDLRPMGRVGIGVKGMTIGFNETVISATVTSNDCKIGLFSNGGLGKKMLGSDLTIQSRGGKGITCYKLNKKTGGLVSANILNNDSKILIIGNNKTIQILESELPTLRRSTSGNILIRESEILSVVVC